MLGKSSRKILKDTLRFAKIKLVYSRITLTKWTTLYFFVALLYCIVLVVLQGVTLSENAQAVGIIGGLLQAGEVPSNTLVVRTGNALQVCRDLPGQPDPYCSIVEGTDTRNIATTHFATDAPSEECLYSLIWLNDTIRDSVREDVVTLIFHIWLFLLSFVAILNESLPHLGAALAGHVLVTAWAGYRFRNSCNLQDLYDAFIMQGPCGTDFMGDWWELRQSHTIVVIVLNAIAFLPSSFFSVRLYKVYAAQTFKRVGASRQIHTVYKLVLLLSVCLQLAGFFTVASTGMWIDKASTGIIRRAAKHLTLYRVVFSVMAALELPWIILGWRSVRKERRRQFIVFWVISLLLLIAGSAIFSSPLYVFIFQTWPFFANMTVVSYVLIVVTTVLGLVCRVHFGKGLPQFLKETEELEGADFAPVYISFEKKSTSVEKQRPAQLPLESNPIASVKVPEPTYKSKRHVIKSTSDSVYSDIMRDTVKLSSTPPLARVSLLGKHDSSFSDSSREIPMMPTPKIGLPSNPKFKNGLPLNPRNGSHVRKPLSTSFP